MNSSGWWLTRSSADATSPAESKPIPAPAADGAGLAGCSDSAVQHVDFAIERCWTALSGQFSGAFEGGGWGGDAAG